MQMRHTEPTSKPIKRSLLGPVAHVFTSTETGSWRLERPKVDYVACIQCGSCELYCPANVITIHKGKAECVEIMWDYCKGCGICANECPKQCIQMVDEREEKNG